MRRRGQLPSLTREKMTAIHEIHIGISGSTFQIDHVDCWIAQRLEGIAEDKRMCLVQIAVFPVRPLLALR